MQPNTLNINDFSYDLPESSIAKYPLAERDRSKLLHFDGKEISSMHFYDLPDLLKPHDFLVFNNTKVIQARIRMRKSSGAEIEIFCLEPLVPNEYQQVFEARESVTWKAMVGNMRRWKGEPLETEVEAAGIKCRLQAIYKGELGNMSHEVEFRWDNPEVTFSEILTAVGELPIPPYLNRKTEASDLTTYQTAYAKELGSVAAPTAGLHFTEQTFAALKEKQIQTSEVTLHIGAGTFQPVKYDEVSRHEMHSELFSVSLSELRRLIDNFGRVVAVGTTSVRTLESLYYIGEKLANEPETNLTEITLGQWDAYRSEAKLTTEEALRAIVEYLERNELEFLVAKTRIIIVPSFKFRIVNRMVTNFHQSKSTLLLLVAAFVGIENQRKIYRYALENNFRFLSYGDSSLLERCE